MKILVINAGSSSVKYQLLDMTTEGVLAKGLCERIGLDGHIMHTPSKGDQFIFNEDIALPDHSSAIAKVLELLTSERHGVIKSVDEISAVGHRVVHGAEYFASSVLIDEAVMDALYKCVPLAPLHNPANITGIEACTAIMKDVPQVAVFDTAFHQTMPPVAFIYALPYEYYEKYKIRRYGFHGTSHMYVSDRAAAMLGKPIEELKIITCHLGNGSSLCAVNGGKSVDTSMGFTPLDGVPMGTRSGSVDNGVIEFLCKNEQLSIGELLNILNKKSGALGVSRLSSDFRDLDEAAVSGNENAALALSNFSYNVAKFIGGYCAAMNGCDALVFTAGIGENSISMRRAICSYLPWLGFELDQERNVIRGKEAVISTDSSRSKILVVPTNEELVIARDTKSIAIS